MATSAFCAIRTAWAVWAERTRAPLPDSIRPAQASSTVESKGLARNSLTWKWTAAFMASRSSEEDSSTTGISASSSRTRSTSWMPSIRGITTSDRTTLKVPRPCFSRISQASLPSRAVATV